MLHTDIPSTTDIDRLAQARADVCLSVYLPTSPQTAEADAARIQAKNLLADAVRQAEEGGLDKRRLVALRESIDELLDDEPFWLYLSNSLAIFATPDDLRTFRLPNHLTAAIEVADRFYVKPLLRTVTFPHTAFVLALAQNSVRLLEVTPDTPPVEVRIGALPTDAASHTGTESLADGTPVRRVPRPEGQTMRLHQYARAIDRALRPLLAGSEVPLILAAANPLASIYRSTNSYAHLADEVLEGNPEALTDAGLASSARRVLDSIHEGRIAEVTSLIDERESRGLVARDLGDIARAATYGAVDTLLVDIDQHVPGTVDEQSGAVTLTHGSPDASDYGVVDEIARRALRSGSRVLAVRADDIPGDGAALAVLRYAV